MSCILYSGKVFSPIAPWRDLRGARTRKMRLTCIFLLPSFRCMQIPITASTEWACHPTPYRGSALLSRGRAGSFHSRPDAGEFALDVRVGLCGLSRGRRKRERETCRERE